MEDVKCPICSSEDSLVERSKVIVNSMFTNVYSVRLICKVCPYSQHLRYTTPNLEQLDKKIKELKRLDRTYQEANGVPSVVVARQLVAALENRDVLVEQMKSLIKNELSNKIN